MVLRYTLIGAMLAGVAFAGVDILSPNMILTDMDGVPVEGVTTSTSTEKAMSKASKLPDGTYKLIRPDSTITVESGCETCIEPPVDPPVEPPTEPPVDPPVSTGKTVAECIAELVAPGFCRIDVDLTGILRTREEVGSAMWGITGSIATWEAWNGAAVNYPKMWFHGGGHNDSGIADIVEWNMETGEVTRVFTAPPFDVLYHDTVADKYAPRHDPEKVPESTHTYNGFMHDPETGLLLLTTGYPYTYGFAAKTPEELEGQSVTTVRGRGTYAFNPTDTAIKGVPPKEWRKVGDYASNYPFLAYHAGGYVLGDPYKGLYRAEWQGDEFNVTSKKETWNGGYAPGAKSHNDVLYLRGDNSLNMYDSNINQLPGWPNANKYYSHGFSLAFYDDAVIGWNGLWHVSSFSPNGTWMTCDFTPDDWNPIPNSQKVYTKWINHPDHPDIFIGWARTNLGPMVYRHDPQACVPLLPVGGDIQQMLDADGYVTLDPAYRYLEAPIIRANQGVDFAWSSVGASSGNGHVTTIGGPVQIKNLKSNNVLRAGVWAEQTPDVTVDGFDISNKTFGVITSNEPDGQITLKNGTIKDGWSTEYGRQHNVYVGNIARAEVINLKSIRNDAGGHLFKSRAKVNVIAGSLFDGDNSNHSRVLDFPCGGDIEIRDSVMIQSPRSDNTDMIAVAVEPCQLPVNTLLLENTQWTATKDGATFMTAHQPVEITCIGQNIFEGMQNPCVYR